MSIFKIQSEKRALPITIDPYQLTARPQYSNWSGEIVNEITAFASSAVLAAVTLLADSVATCSLDYTRTNGGRIERLDMPSVLLRPNADQLQFEFIHQFVTSMAVHGVTYLYAPKTAVNGLPVEMRILDPKSVTPKIDKNTDEMTWVVGKNKTVLTRNEVRQVDWLKMAGSLVGLAPIEVLRNTIGVSIAMERFLGQFYGEGAIPSSVMESDKPITKEQAQVLRDTWSDTHRKNRMPAVLSNGLRWRPIVTSATDAQMLEHREAIVRDIARAYRIPSHLINGVGGDSQTYQNVESAGIQFVRHTLLPWMRRIEDAISDTLPLEYRVRFNADEFLRADLRTRVTAQATQIQSGTLTPNEARLIEGREPYVGGDAFLLALAGAPMAGGAELAPLGTDSVTAGNTPQEMQ
jgi:HK97 family phage portal protein